MQKHIRKKYIKIKKKLKKILQFKFKNKNFLFFFKYFLIKFAKVKFFTSFLFYIKNLNDVFLSDNRTFFNV